MTKLPDPQEFEGDPVLRESAARLAGQSSSAPGTARTPRTAVATLAANANRGLQARLETLERERSAGELVVKLDPKDIAHSKFANRHMLSLQLADPEFASLVESFRKDGQDQPIVVRPTPPGSSHSKPYEVGFGHRRLQAALILDQETDGGWRVDARIKNLTNRELIALMDRENEDRKPLSPYERGAHFKTWINEGEFKNIHEIAEYRHLSHITVLKYIQVAELPEFVVEAFGDPREIALNWIQELVRVLKHHKTAVMAEASRLKSSDPPLQASMVYAALVRAGANPPAPESSPDEQIIRLSRNRLGMKLVRRKGSLRIKFGGDLDEEYQKTVANLIKKAATEYLHEHPPSPTEPARQRRKREKS